MTEEMLVGELPEVEFTDQEGHVHRYREEMVIPFDNKYFAILVAIPGDDCEDECSCHAEAEAIIARIEQEDGEDGEYVQPTDEEFEAVLNIYETVELED